MFQVRIWLGFYWNLDSPDWTVVVLGGFELFVIVTVKSFHALIADLLIWVELFFYLEGKIKDNFEFFKDDNKDYNNYYCYC